MKQSMLPYLTLTKIRSDHDQPSAFSASTSPHLKSLVNTYKPTPRSDPPETSIQQVAQRDWFIFRALHLIAMRTGGD